MESRLKINIRGLVQGIGFRPYIYSLAKEHNLKGFVLNNSDGVYLEIEGTNNDVRIFLNSVRENPLPQADVFDILTEQAVPAGYRDFEIRLSEHQDKKSVPVSAERATCDECVRELFDPDNRRYEYPFINCTHCGPRFSIVREIPYDRINTTMSEFVMCEDCSREYKDPSDRRFHAQPNACEVCGPQLSLLNGEGRAMAVNDVIAESSRLLKDGYVISVKGLGGYHLACDASNQDAVSKLRTRKYREYKPFAIMVKDITTVKDMCHVNRKEEDLLKGVKRPIVLLKKRNNPRIAMDVAPNQNYLGVMLPYTPLHHLLLEKSGLMLVMTSANISSEPIVYEEDEAVKRLRDIADFYLVHNREIHIRTDDSVSRIWNDEEIVIRRSRGYAPLPILMKKTFTNNVLACGADLKNVFCLTKDNHVYVSHHIGDLDNVETLTSLTEGISHYKRIFDIEPSIVACDLHPHYVSSKFARSLSDVRKIGIQHHYAHIVSCMADNEIEQQVIGIAFDGTGYGTDGNIWGGEFLVCDYEHFERVAHIEYFPLPGGDHAIAEPWRTAASLLNRMYGDHMFQRNIDFIKQLDTDKWKIIRHMTEKNINLSLTSSMGRLFDAVSAILGVRGTIYYEGQAAIELEMIADPDESGEYAFDLKEGDGKKEILLSRLMNEIIKDIESGIGTDRISAKFHNTIATIALEISLFIRDLNGINSVCLSGGVFQNIFLLDRLYKKLKDNGFNVYTHHRVPTNDGGIALGQAVIANALIEKGEPR
ncbi:MAG: carbamoyltransferase HypF [Nitrospiraceae bacterium]|nr:MAG: carbamoyltransferase HypF [Nitrospiraceae bacterium]